MHNSVLEEYDDRTDRLDGMWLGDLNFSARTSNALYNNGIRSFKDLISRKDNDLLELRGLGQKGYEEIKKKLESLSGEVLLNLINTSDTNARNVDNVSGKIRIDEDMLDVPIENVNFSLRTHNALFNNGVRTLGDLTNYDFNDLRVSFRGMGEAGVQEIKAYLRQVVLEESIELHEFILSNIKESQQIIFDRYYGLSNSYGKTTLEDVAKEHDITRERVRQINKAVLTKIGKAIKSKRIQPNIELTILENINSPIRELPELSGVYQKHAIARIYADTQALGIRLYKNPRLNSEWIVDNDFNIDEQVARAFEALKSQIGAVKISDLANSFSLNDKILYDMSNTTISDGLIVLNSNRRATGNDYGFEIVDYMDKVVRPVTTAEICDALNLTDNQVRGLLSRIPGVVNVGLSTYALEKYGYTNKKIIEIIEEFLLAEGHPAPIDRIISYVQKYRLVKDKSVLTQISVYPQLFTKLDDGYYALTEWGYTSVQSTKNRLEVSAKEAVLNILSKSDLPMSPSDILKAIVVEYGDKSTNKAVTVSSVLVNLYNNGTLAKYGTDRSPYYTIRKDQ